MTKDEAMDLALEALEYIENNYMSLPKSGSEAITAIKQARALDKKAENARELGLDYEPPCKTGSQCTSKCQQCVVQEPDYKALWQQMCERCDELDKELSATDRQVEILSDALAESRREVAAPVQEPVAFNAGVPPLYPEMKDGETISVEYTNPPAAQKDIQRLSALVRAQQITIDKLEQARSAPYVASPRVQEPVAIVDEDGVIVVCNYKYKPGDKLYTTPPAAQRQWVGLTDEEIADEFYKFEAAGAWYQFAHAIEAKLKDKNGGVV